MNLKKGLSNSTHMVEAANPHKAQANMYFNQGKINFERGNYEKCVRDLQFAESLFSTLNSKELAAESMFILGHAYLNLNQKKYALKSLNEAFIKFTEIQDVEKAAECALKMGSLHRECKNIEKSKKFLDISKELFENIGKIEHLGDSWKEIGNTLLKDVKNPDSVQNAKLAYQKAIHLFKRAKAEEKKALAEIDLALLSLSTEDEKDALSYFLSAMSYFEHKKQDDFLVTIVMQIAKIYLKLEKKKKAQEYYDKAVEIMKRNNYSPEKIEQLKHLF
ncbi:MAG: hypothetical protein K9W46_13015 [Candidatus Heimdallarchaeum endolithica]|uniref:Tetratricopeptide repeat protein n=1 Tax=Candidatus Heimdallarchaeum endolithica TaxID=2876572 RepID=A0A9Y1BRZ6_9ARCH|nr:MAG: hypothetical protein K9W46_13015 [Candidatus Heimdallarchaeum endolithica]